MENYYLITPPTNSQGNKQKTSMAGLDRWLSSEEFLTAFEEVQGSVPSTPMVAHNHL